MDAAESAHESLLRRVRTGELPRSDGQRWMRDAGLTSHQAVEIFHSQVLSRQLDRVSRKLQARGEGFYTIGSSGHEGTAAIAEAVRVDDMAFLHYRDAAFQIQRAKKLPGQTPTWDMLLSFAASADDPISSGRHKVLGSKALNIPPQTSTIASHLPKAVGAAYSIGAARRLAAADRQLADDAVILCTFGDASVNHSTAQGAFNTATWTAFQGVPMPIVFVCEDNGIGISTRTPPGWVEAGFSQRPALKYIKCDGLNLFATYAAAREAAATARRLRRPVFLHMICVRLYGHAGSDLQAAYLTRAEIEEIDANDPLAHSAALLIDAGVLTAEQVLRIYLDSDRAVQRAAEDAISRPKLLTRAQVRASLIPPRRAALVAKNPPEKQRLATFGSDAASLGKPQHMARLINWALTDLMLTHSDIIVAGEDVGPKGGVYGVTTKLHARFGGNRVINTLLDEQSILGLAIGAAHNGILPIVEIQFLAYLHNAEDQLRGEAATLSFFSSGQYTNPMIVRIAGLGYQKGFGGHFHNDNSLSVLRDIPGLVVACPSSGGDAVRMLRECVRLVREEQRVIVFVEPIALYMTRDLHADKDGLWTSTYEPAGSAPAPRLLGEVNIFGDGEEVAIVTYGNGYYLSRQAESILRERHGVHVRVIDLRWISPLPEESLLEAVRPCSRVLIVDECRISGSLSEALMALFVERAPQIRASRVAAIDSFIPLGRAATLPLPSRDEIVNAAIRLVGERPREVQRA
jgi:2-oxoisovalerate dehydrogenase E1 component